jgi:tRNA(fMet)-specific endonuclease VapC
LAVRSVLLDGNAYTAFKKGVPEAVEILRHAPLIGLDSIATGELLGLSIGRTLEDFLI